MDQYTAQLDFLIDLEARHEDLLVRLDALDKRVEKTLAECRRYSLSAGENPQDSASRSNNRMGSEEGEAERTDWSTKDTTFS